MFLLKVWNEQYSYNSIVSLAMSWFGKIGCEFTNGKQMNVAQYCISGSKSNNNELKVLSKKLQNKSLNILSLSSK